MNSHERIDGTVGGVDFTQKVMSNGEKRTRMRLPSGVVTTITEMSDYLLDVPTLPWQESHFHKGLIEDYLVLNGWILLAEFWYPCESPRYSIKTAGTHVRIGHGVAHNVLPGPGAVFQSTTSGIPVGNTDRKENDWWPYNWLDTRISGDTGSIIHPILQGVERS